MRLRSLALASIVPVILIVAPRAVEAQRTRVRCRDVSACIIDGDGARVARARAARLREDALDRARFARQEARALQARMRAEERRDRARDRARDLREARRHRPDQYRVRW